MESANGDLGHPVELDEGALILKASYNTLDKLALDESGRVLLDKG